MESDMATKADFRKAYRALRRITGDGQAKSVYSAAADVLTGLDDQLARATARAWIGRKTPGPRASDAECCRRAPDFRIAVSLNLNAARFRAWRRGRGPYCPPTGEVWCSAGRIGVGEAA